MSQEFSLFTAACTVALALLLLVDLFRGRRQRAVIGFALLTGVVVALHLTSGFPMAAEGRVAFGQTFPIFVAVGLMFASVVIGMACHYVWHRPSRWSWSELLRPLVASPIVLLPLIGSLEGSPLKSVQLVSLTLLAFQNGFFWPRILRDAEPRQP